MSAGRFFKAGIVGVLLVGAAVFGPMPASASNMWSQQAILLVHINLGGGQFFTTNYVFAANEAGNTTVNVKCFNDAFQRIGPVGGVNVQLNALGQLAQHTPTTLLVTTDPLFTGVGWCWGNNVTSSADFNTQITLGLTTDLTPGGILNSSASTFIASNTGLAETSAGVGGIPYFTTSGDTQNFAIFINPQPTATTLTLQLFDAAGTPLGSSVVRTFNGRSLQSLSIPAVFGVTPMPASGTVRISASANGFLGWFVVAQGSTTTRRLQFTVIGLDEDNTALLQPANAP